MIDKVPDPLVKSDDKNLRSNLRNNLCKHLTSFRRFGIKEDFKTSVVPKVATEVATSVI